MIAHHLLVKASFRRPAHRRPFWIVNQTSLFRDFIAEFEQKTDYLSTLTNPQDATEISLHPFYELKVDAIELFTNLFLPAFYMNLGCTFEGHEIMLHKPVRSTFQANKLKIPDVDAELGFISETISNLRAQSFDAPVIGTCAGAFSLSSFLIEGNVSKDIPLTKAVLYAREDAFTGILGKINEFLKTLVQAQIDAGAEAICIHDPLASALSYEDFERIYLPVLMSLASGLSRDEIPLIYNADGAFSCLNLLKNVGFDVITLDWHCSIQEALVQTEGSVSIQSNFDPMILLGTPDTIQTKIEEHLRKLGREHGFIGAFSGRIPTYASYPNLKLFVRKYQELSGGYATS